MDIGTLIGTGLGAVVGVGSTMLADRARWKRDELTRQQELKRQLYGDYLVALTRTRNQLKDLVRQSNLTPDELAHRAGELYREGGAYELRYQMAITASQRIVEPSDNALRRLRDVRDKIQEHAPGTQIDSELGRLIVAIKGLRDAMRSDLGTG
ncbi:hypothetical protein [Streptomyces triticagri]|uniref:hypothetical protein n=1 Tax=Streptomyces triticagri TaxID=2293568 RepID=UPI000FFC686D|nr:hypothetical protein [Streptomyces triticagri]